jgi:hypothetical protein
MAGRRAKRFESKYPVPVTVTGGGLHFVAPMADVSSNGVRVRCGEPLKAGAIFRLIIGTLRQAVHTPAVVRRVDGSGASFEFRGMTMTDRELLRKMLFRLSAATIAG